MPTPSQLQAFGDHPEDQVVPKARRPRGTSEKAVANATLSAVQKIYPVLVALDAEQRKRALSAVAVLLDDGTP